MGGLLGFLRRLPTAPTAVRNAENGGPAGGRAVTAIENPRPSLPRPLTSPCHCRLRFSISCPVRAPAGPRKYVRYTAGPFTALTQTLFPRPGDFVARSVHPRREPSARPLRLAPWASGVAPGLIRTARARATIVQESAKCENTDVCNSWRPFLALERSSEKAFKNAKHGSQLLRSSS